MYGGLREKHNLRRIHLSHVMGKCGLSVRGAYVKLEEESGWRYIQSNFRPPTPGRRLLFHWAEEKGLLGYGQTKDISEASVMGPWQHSKRPWIVRPFKGHVNTCAHKFLLSTGQLRISGEENLNNELSTWGSPVGLLGMGVLSFHWCRKTRPTVGDTIL